MIDHRTAPGPTPTRTTEQASPQVSAKTSDLTVNKVLAGAGAAATSAVLGSYLGAVGTVGGAALGSVASMLATTVYQRSLDRTRATLAARIRLADGRSVDVVETPPTEVSGDTTVPMPLPSGGDVTRLQAEPGAAPPVSGRRRWILWVSATALVFALGLLAVTGVEWIKGSTLTANESGTSVGRVLDPGTGAAEAEPTETPEPTSTPEPTTEPSTTTDPESTPTPTPSAPDGTDGSTPSTETGGAQPTPVVPVPNVPTPG